MNILRRGPVSAAALCVVFATASLSAAQPDPRFDPSTGRDLANWPPSPQFQYKHLRLVIDIPDMNAPFFTGTATHTVSPVGAARSALTLSAGSGITVKAIRIGGRAAAYTHEKGVL